MKTLHRKGTAGREDGTQSPWPPRPSPPRRLPLPCSVPTAVCHSCGFSCFLHAGTLTPEPGTLLSATFSGASPPGRCQNTLHAPCSSRRPSVTCTVSPRNQPALWKEA